MFVKYFKVTDNMRINDSVGWGVSRDVGAEVFRYVDVEVNISKVNYMWFFVSV